MMKKALSLILALVMLLGVMMAFSSCGGKKDANIAIYLSDQLYDFDPALAFVNDDAQKVLKLLYEPLFTLDAKGNYKYALAKSYNIIEDQTTNTYKMEITLRDTYWSDGSEVTAEDVVYAWKRILDPNFKSQAAPLLYDVKNAVAVKKGTEGISVDDVGLEANKKELTITFETKIDYDAFLRNLTSLALVPLRENTLTTNNAESWWSKRTAFIVTNGVFKIRTLNMDAGEFTLERNTYYRSAEGKTNASTIVPAQLNTKWTDEQFWDNFDGDINLYTDNRLDAFLDKTIFYLGCLPVEEGEGSGVRGEYAKQIKTANAFSTYTYIFNTNKELFADARVRLALSMVIDREAIAEKLVYAEAATGLISPAVWEANKSNVSFRSQCEEEIIAAYRAETSMQEAERLLEEAGVSGGSFRLTVRDTPEEQYIAQYVKSRWEELGFRVTCNFVTYDTDVWATEKDGGREITIGSADNTSVVYDDYIQAAYHEADFDVLGVDYQMYSTNAFTALCGFTTTMNGNGIESKLDAAGNYTYSYRTHCSGFADEKYDALLDRALAEKDLTKRAAILHEAEAYLMSQMPVMPIVFNQNYYMSQNLSGLTVDYYGMPSFTTAKLK